MSDEKTLVEFPILGQQKKEPVKLPVEGVTLLEEIESETEEELVLLAQRAEEAAAYLSDFPWCAAIKDIYFGDGIGEIFCIFLVHITPAVEGVDEFLWVIVGDLPPLYLVTAGCPSPEAAMEGYIKFLRQWVAGAKEGKNMEDEIPIDLPANRETALAIEARLDLLTEKILPMWF